MSGGGEWKPFEIDAREYAELVHALQHAGSYRTVPEPPDWVQTQTDWLIWLAEHEDGVPADEHRRLHAEADAAHQAFLDSWDEAVRQRDPLVPVRRFHESVSASRAVEDLKAGRARGSTDAERDTEVNRIARAASDAQMALHAAERIGDSALVDKWRAELQRAETTLHEIFPTEAQAGAAMASASGIAWNRR